MTVYQTTVVKGHTHCASMKQGITSVNNGHNHQVQVRGNMAIAIAFNTSGQPLDHEHYVTTSPCSAGCGSCKGR